MWWFIWAALRLSKTFSNANFDFDGFFNFIALTDYADCLEVAQTIFREFFRNFINDTAEALCAFLAKAVDCVNNCNSFCAHRHHIDWTHDLWVRRILLSEAMCGIPTCHVACEYCFWRFFTRTSTQKFWEIFIDDVYDSLSSGEVRLSEWTFQTHGGRSNCSHSDDWWAGKKFAICMNILVENYWNNMKFKKR